MKQFEIEVKFYLTDTASVRNKIIKLGADCKGRVFETNIRFDDKNNNLIQKNFLLRLRKDIKTTLTYKYKSDIKDNNFKILKELEVEVNDFTTMGLILEFLGFNKKQIYEKWRETFELNNAILCIDTMPYGDFLEIEGEKEEIKNLAASIGLEWKSRITDSYLKIFDIIKRDLNLTFYDVTFNNFKNIRIDFSQYLYFLEADKMRPLQNAPFCPISADG